jgi:hypothetical protein
MIGNRAEYSRASDRSTSLLNNQLREPDLLVLVEWGVYECTINDPNGRQYNQSTLAILIDVPSAEDVAAFRPFNVWVAPPGTQYVTFLNDGSEKPSKDDLWDNMGWKEVKIGVAPERPVRTRGGYQAIRKQYSLKHVGAMTVNKSQGDTIPGTLAVEMSVVTCPWEKNKLLLSSAVPRELVIL